MYKLVYDWVYDIVHSHHMILDMDLDIFDWGMPNYFYIQNLKYILDGILEVRQCNLEDKNMLDFQILFDKVNSVRMEMECKMVDVQ